MDENKIETQELEERLTDALGEEAKHRILTDQEDRYVYSFGKIFLQRDPTFGKGGERVIPNIVVKSKSSEEADLVRQISLKSGFLPIYRDRILNPEPKGDGERVLIDSTELLYPPEPEGRKPPGPSEKELLKGGVRLTMNSAPGPIEDSNTIPLKAPSRDELPEKCMIHSPCKGYCPIGRTLYDDIETWSSKGRYIVSRGLVRGEIEHSEKVSNILFSCATCGNCFRNCTQYLDKLYEASIEAKRKVINDRGGVVPTTIREALESTFRTWNPWGEPKSRRSDWMKDLDFEVPVLEEGDSAEILLYVGCTPSYDTRVQEAARSLAKLLIKHFDLDVGVLGNREKCCGNAQRALGEEGLYELLVEENSKEFSSVDFDTMITISSHCYHTFKNEYPELGMELDPVHYTEFIEKRIGEVELSQQEKKTVTYHDPCYLDNHNDIHDPPRNLIREIPNLEFVDIESGTQCCGGGGGRMWFDDPERVKYPSEPILEDAMNAGAEILSVACPFCMIQFEDATKVMGIEEKISVKDISELLCSSIEKS